MITNAQRARMEDEGLILLEDLFSRAEMDELADLIEAHHRRHEEAIVDSGGTEGISRAGEISFTSHLAEQDPGIRAFATRPEFAAISTDLLGPDTDLYWNQSVYKGPEGDCEFPWHQDDGYTPVEPSPYLTLWLALNDATPENGCISVLPGSHRRGLLPHHRTPLGQVCHESDDPDQGIQVPVRAGSAAVFWSLTCHKSGVNRSNGVRKAYILQYSHSPLRSLSAGAIIEGLIPVARGGKAAY